jgi:hypothetical protein
MKLIDSNMKQGEFKTLLEDHFLINVDQTKSVNKLHYVYLYLFEKLRHGLPSSKEPL